MISDVVYEQIIKKKYETKDFLKAFFSMLLCFAVPSIIVFAVVFFVTDGILYIISMIGYVALVYIAAFVIAIGLVRNTFYEYEYTFVNGEMTIDKIIAKTKRKRMLSFDVKNVEDMGIFNADKFTGDKEAVLLVYSDTYSGNGDLYMDFRHATIGRTIVVIKADERLAKALKPYIRRNLFKEVYPEI